MLTFKKLDVYRCSVRFLKLASRLAAKVPKGHGDLASQLRRASLSIPLNIAEGSGRKGRDAMRFYVIARGSALECAALLDGMVALEITGERELEEHNGLLDRIAAMLWKMGEGQKMRR